MAGLTVEGFVVKTFQEIRDEIDAYQKAEIDEGLDTDDDSPLGQINISAALEASKEWEALQAIVSSFDPDQATGWSLDRIASITGTVRSDYVKTTVVGLVQMEPNKALPVGSTANLTGRPNTTFKTIAEVPSNPGGGYFYVDFEASEAGSTTVDVDQLSEISVAVDGWLSVANDVVGITGEAPEDDPDFRDKRELELASSGSTSLAAILADISRNVDGVAALKGFENDTSGVVDEVPAHSIQIIVRGGTDADIAEQIYLSKGCGTGTHGDVIIQVADSEGVEHTVRFDRDVEKVFYATVTVSTEEGWAGDDAKVSIKARIAEYVNDLDIGKDVIYDKVKAAALLETGVEKVTIAKIGLSSPPTLEVDIESGKYDFVVADVANIEVLVA